MKGSGGQGGHFALLVKKAIFFVFSVDHLFIIQNTHVDDEQLHATNGGGGEARQGAKP